MDGGKADKTSGTDRRNLPFYATGLVLHVTHTQEDSATCETLSMAKGPKGSKLESAPMKS